MRPFSDTIPLEQARALIEQHTRPIARTELIPLHEANGRVSAVDVISPMDVPPFSRAGMDGYAVRASDTTGATRTTPKTLAQIGVVYTGQVPTDIVTAGRCVEIATGAPMPEGADAVVMVEDTGKDSDGNVRVLAPVMPRQNVGRQGADISAGQTVIHSGAYLNASRIGALAAIGIGEVSVFVKPRVAILSTGNEIVDPGGPIEPGQIYDINRFTLTAIVSEHGGVPEAHRTAADTLDDLRRAIDDCLDADMIVFSGGSSVGERDLVMDAIAARGRVLFHGVSIKPGKPTAFAMIGDKPVFGMPGYPTSCLSNAYILLAPMLRTVARLPPQRMKSITLPLAERIASVPGKHQIYTVRIADGAVRPAFKASGDITSMSLADGYIEIDAETQSIDAGQLVEVKLF
jgi:molybdopterin molybdotransferase